MSPEKDCRFFITATAAGRAGSRLHLRCRSELVSGHSPVEVLSNLARTAARMIDEDFLQEYNLTTLAAAVGVIDRHLRRILRAEFDVSPIEYAQTQRLLFVKRLLTDTAMPAGDAAFVAGFGNVRRLNSGFSEHYDFVPTCLCSRTTAPRAENGPTLMLSYRPSSAWDALLAFLQVCAVDGVEVVDTDGYAHTTAVDYNGMRRTG